MFAWRLILLTCVFVIYPSGSAKPPYSYPKLDIYPNTSIIYKPNSNHSIMCVGDNSRFIHVIYLYQIKNDKINFRAKTKSNVLKAVLQLTEHDNGTSLQCYTKWKYHTKATKPIDLLLNSAPDAKSAQESVTVSVLFQLRSANAEPFWKYDGLLTTTIVIIILLTIIMLIMIREQRSKSQGFLSSDSILHSGKLNMNFGKKYDSTFKSCGYKRITDNYGATEIQLI